MKLHVGLRNALLCDDCFVAHEGLFSRGSLMIRRPTVMVPSFQQQNSKEYFLSMRYRMRKSIVEMFLATEAALEEKIGRSDCPVAFAVLWGVG